MLLEEYQKGFTKGNFPTGRKANQCQVTIKDKLIEWLEMSAIEFVCDIEHIDDYEDKVSTLLGKDQKRVKWPG